MQVEAKELEAELALRADRRVPTTGVEYVCVQGVEGLRDAGVLSGVRAMVARVYGGEEWYVNDDGCGRAECLYERAGLRVHATRFIIARRVGDDSGIATGTRKNEHVDREHIFTADLAAPSLGTHATILTLVVCYLATLLRPPNLFWKWTPPSRRSPATDGSLATTRPMCVPGQAHRQRPQWPRHPRWLLRSPILLPSPT